MTGVGTQKVFEDDRTIDWHLDPEPGEGGDLHTHKLDYVVRVISRSTVEVSGPHGELLCTVEVEAGGIVNFRMESIKRDRSNIGILG